MKYYPPFRATNDNESFVNARPGQKGSAVPAGAIEWPQREIVRVIEKAGLTPADELQLFQAIEILIQEAMSSGSGSGGWEVGDFDLLSFPPELLPEYKPGWYHRNGARYLLDSDQGQALYSLPKSWRQAHNVTIVEMGGLLTINVPTAYYPDGRGMFERPGTPVGRTVDDTMRPITGTTHGTPAQGGSLSGAITSTIISGGAGSGTALLLHQYTLNSGRLSPNHNGTETAGLHVCLTPAIFLGV